MKVVGTTGSEQPRSVVSFDPKKQAVVSVHFFNVNACAVGLKVATYEQGRDRNDLEVCFSAHEVSPYWGRGGSVSTSYRR